MWTYHLESCLLFIFWSTCPYAKDIFCFCHPVWTWRPFCHKKSWFLATEKNQFFSSGEKILHHTKKFIKQKSSILLSYTWNGPKFFTSDQSLKCCSRKFDFLKNAKNFKICQILDFSQVRKIVAKGWKMTIEGYFFVHMGPNTYVQGYMLLNGLLDHVHSPQRSIYWSGHFMPPPRRPVHEPQ